MITSLNLSETKQLVSELQLSDCVMKISVDDSDTAEPLMITTAPEALNALAFVVQ